MNDTNKCERHPDEIVVGVCIHCKRNICRVCREEYGYFCSEDCKEKTKQETGDLARPEEKQKYAILEQKVNRWMRVMYMIILPGLAVLLSLFIAFKVTSRAGEVIWEFRPDEDKPLSALTSHSGNIYVGSDNGILYALDAEQGTVKWKFKSAESLAMAKPVIFGENLCITWDKKNIYAADAEEGSLVWKRAFAGEIAETPITGENTIYYISNFYKELKLDELKNQNISAFDNLLSFTDTNIAKIRIGSSIYALDPDDGHDIWAKALSKDASPGNFTSQGGLLYLSVCGLQDDKWGCTLLAIDAGSGKGRWKAELSSGSLSGIYPAESGVLILSMENFYFISHEGKEIWNRSREESSLWEPIVAEGKIYLEEEKNKLTCLKLNTGKKIWATEVTSLASGAVIGEGLLFLPGLIERSIEKDESKQTKMPQPKVPGLDTGEFLKQFGGGEEPSVKMVPVLHALDTQTGKIIWTKEKIGGKVLYYKGKIFAVKSHGFFSLLDQKISTSNQITAIHVPEGKILWQYGHKGVLASTVIDENTFCFTSYSTAMHVGSIFSGKIRPPTDNAIYAISIGR